MAKATVYLVTPLLYLGSLWADDNPPAPPPPKTIDLPADAIAQLESLNNQLKIAIDQYQGNKELIRLRACMSQRLTEAECGPWTQDNKIIIKTPPVSSGGK